MLIVAVTILFAASICLYVVWPRAADLTSFTPKTMAQLETLMWRNYYEKHFIRLFYALY